jgi:glucosyl-dolichyl phosphate glucuronosyltransferase
MGMMNDICKPEISVIICTYRRPDVIEAAIKSLVKQSLDPNKFEIIIVDNNSQDETLDIVQPFIRNLFPKVRFVIEDRQGLSYARNTGVELSHADIVAFIDDDAIADVTWLTELIDVYRNFPEVSAVGGKIIPLWEESRPIWFTDSLLGYLSVIDWGEETKFLKWPERLLGTNSSFRKNILIALGGFDVNLGRRGNLLMGSEETMLQKAIMEKGHNVVYAPKAIVYHRISAIRISREYLRRIAYGDGRTDAFLQKHNQSVLTVSKRIFLLIKMFCKNSWNFTFNRFEEKPIEILLSQAYDFGYVIEAIRQIFIK